MIHGHNIFQTILYLFHFGVSIANILELRISGLSEFVRHFAFVQKNLRNLILVFLHNFSWFFCRNIEFVRNEVDPWRLEWKHSCTRGSSSRNWRQMFILNDNVSYVCCRTQWKFQIEAKIYSEILGPPRGIPLYKIETRTFCELLSTFDWVYRI